MTLPSKVHKNQPNEVTQVPKYGLKVPLNHVYPERRSQNYIPTLKEIWTIFPLILRYIWYYIKARFTGRSIVMDYMKPLEAKQIYGVPLGGIGCGSIGRGYRGEFTRFQLRPGLYDYNEVEANQFIITIKDSDRKTIFHSLLSSYPKKKLSSWQSYIDGNKCFYTGLYPRSWTEYDLSEYGVEVVCRQISPIIPQNYKDSSLPCSVFVWNIENVCDEERIVTIAFTFKNGTGVTSSDSKSTCSSREFSYLNTGGVLLEHIIEDMPCTYALGVKSTQNLQLSKCLYFDPNSDGSKPWNELKNDGRFEKKSASSHDRISGEMGCGVAAKVSIPPSENAQIDMSLVWDMPVVWFPQGKKKHKRLYAKYFDAEDAALRIVHYAFENYGRWEEAICKWQNEVLKDEELPDWYKTALFNETYFVSDGGSIWLMLDPEEAKSLPTNDPRIEYGRYAYLEGHEYRMCNTYDVHFYASFALAMNWPMIQFSLQYDLRDAIYMEIPEKWKMLYDGHMVERKRPNTVPHDVGDPGEDPFVLPNSYPIHDVSAWRDLNVKFVLQVFRDVSLSNFPDVSETYVRDMYDACYTVMLKTQEFDTDGDGLIENSGTPDQTFDTWVMCGSSSYCGGLWLAALYAMTKMASLLDKKKDRDLFQDLLDRGKKSFEKKLWNGTYYNFDCSPDECKSIMADQLCGEWYLASCQVQDEVFPADHVTSALKTIFENNVSKFCDGNLGAVNGFIDGQVDRFTIQSLEVWTGVTYGLAAHMILKNMRKEAFHTAGGMFKSMSERMGLAFQTPEALYAEKYYRALGYMRPLSIWSIQLALNIVKGRKNAT